MASYSLTISTPLQLQLSHASQQRTNSKEYVACNSNAGLWSSSRSLSAAGVSNGSMGGTGVPTRRPLVRAEAEAREGAVTSSDKWGKPVTLGTAVLPADVDLGKLESLLFQWGNSITANANLPLPNPLKVDRVKGGVRLGYIRVNNGAVEDLVHIDVTVSAATTESKPMFQALRCGQYNNVVPPGEPLIMQSLLAALRKSIQLARP